MHARFCIALVLAVGLITASPVAQQVASTILFTSTRDNPNMVPPITGGEIYMIDHLADGSFSEPRRLTANFDADIFPTLSPDGRGKIVFDSNRFRAPGEPSNTSDLFLMNHDGGGLQFLTRGGSPTWSPPGPRGRASKMIAFHASASGTGLPINPFPGAATADSDIFAVNVDDLLEYRAVPQNLTSNRTATVDDDPSWSPDGRKILFTSYIVDPSTTLTPSEVYMMDADGSHQEQLTNDKFEKRGATWSPDGTRILFACRLGGKDAAGVVTFELCVMDGPYGAITRLTDNSVSELTPTWSPDGRAIVFHKVPSNTLWVISADGTGETQLTGRPGSGDVGRNLLATSWGVIEVGRTAR